MIRTTKQNYSIWHMALWGVTVVAISVCFGIATTWAEEGESTFEVAEIYFELNNTDGDLGIHSLVDGEPWKRLQIEDPRERQLLNIFVQGRLRKQGLTELFFESAEPFFLRTIPRTLLSPFSGGLV